MVRRGGSNSRHAGFREYPGDPATTSTVTRASSPSCPARHEPVWHAENLGFRDHRKATLLVEADIGGFVGLQIRHCCTLVHTCAKLGHHGPADTTSLDGSINCDRS